MTTPHPWLVTPAKRPAAGTRLVCLPHAGGSASFYRRWAQHLDCDVELQIVQYPGREERVNEPFLTDPGKLVEAVTGAVLETARPDVETVLFGHSMGALIGYETVRAWRRAACAWTGCSSPARQPRTNGSAGSPPRRCPTTPSCTRSRSTAARR